MGCRREQTNHCEWIKHKQSRLSDCRRNGSAITHDFCPGEGGVGREVYIFYLFLFTQAILKGQFQAEKRPPSSSSAALWSCQAATVSLPPTSPRFTVRPGKIPPSLIAATHV